MKDAIHHLKQVQKKVLQAVRKAAAAEELQTQSTLSKQQDKQTLLSSNREK